MRVNLATRHANPKICARAPPTRGSGACARNSGPTCEVLDPRANERAHVRGEERRQLTLGAVSHAIRLSELSAVSANVAIPTIWLRGATQCRGNCMRHSWDSSPGGSHALPPIAPPVAQPVAQPVAPPVARRWRASGLAWWIPSPQTTCPSPTTTDQGTTHRLALKQPPPTPTFPHQHAERSPLQQHVVSYNPIIGQPHTGPRCGKHRNEASRPTKKVTFPRNKADKSPLNQHVLPILIVGPNQLKHRLSRTNKPKSRPSSNT